MKNTTVFKNFNDIVKDVSLAKILSQIKTEPKLKNRIQSLRQLLAQGDKRGYDNAKKSLLAFTPSGTFANGRKVELLETYTQYIILDIDKLEAEALEEILKIVREIPYTLTCFVSPSGKGIKIIVEVDSNESDHTMAYNQVKIFYENQIQHTIDRSGKDITRLCFYSYDPEIFINENHLIFEIDKGQNVMLFSPIDIPPLTAEEKPEQNKPVSVTNEIGIAYTMTTQKQSYIPGNRNNFIYLLASNCNRLGIPETEIQAFANTEFVELAPSEIRQTVTSAYKHHQNEFGKYQNQQSQNKKHQNTAYSQHNKPPLGGLEEKSSIDKVFPFGEDLDGATIDKLLLNTPFLPEEIFPILPDLLREGCDILSDKRQRDVYLTSALSILSGCIQNVTGIYDGDSTFANLFSFVIAPAASGKGALKYARMLGEDYHQKLLDESNRAKQIFIAETSIYKEAIAKALKNGSTIPDEPQEPPFKMLFIPANTSSSMVMKHLKDNDGFGVLCESEADTMGNSLKSEWSNYSDLLRKAFHFEPLSLSRKSNKEFVEIKQPRLSVAISGTPEQIIKLIPNAENGLFSRFIFYAFSTKATWRNVSRKAHRISYSKFFSALSQRTLVFIEYIETMSIDFDFTDEQWNTLNTDFEQYLRKAFVFQGGEALSSIKRSGIIQFRIAMLLTAIRIYEDRSTPEVNVLMSAADGIYKCTDQDFYIAQALTAVYIQHATCIFEKLPKSEGGLLLNKNNSKLSFFQTLPEEFEFCTAIEQAEIFKISPRTVRNYLNNYLENGLLSKTQYGHYAKTIEMVRNF